MLRKANETKRQIIESLNKRLMNENKSLDSKIEAIVKDAHKKMDEELNNLFQNEEGTGLVTQKFSDWLSGEIKKSEDMFISYLQKEVPKEMDKMKSKRGQ